MDIRKADSKGRVTVGEDGVVYHVQRDEDGSIHMWPLKVPEMPKVDRNAPRGIYVGQYDEWGSRRGCATVLVNSVISGNLVEDAKTLAEWANHMHVPVFVDARGAGAALADTLAPLVARDVIVTGLK